MPTWKTTRVFISSTFRDMHAERDHLVKAVFPELRESLQRDRIHLVDIDLRWGVTKEQADNDLDLCLKQIDTCRPFFVGILGERYGWVPQQFPADLDGKHLGWIQYHTGKSLTELEMLYGVLNDPKMYDRAMFFLRDATFVSELTSEQQQVYCEGPTEDELRELAPADAEARAEGRRQKLAELKHRVLGLRERLFVFENYPCQWGEAALDPVEKTPGHLAGLEEFGEQVRVQLEKAIRTAPELQEHFAALANPPPDPYGLLEEQDYHERFVESRLQVYVGRDEIHRELLDYAESDDPKPLLVTGGSGTGKSAILARLSRDFRERQPDTFAVAHFVGASPSSTSHYRMLRRFCLELRERFVLTQTVKVQAGPGGEEQEEVRPYEVPKDPVKLLPAFREMVTLVPEGERVLFVIDAVNQLDDFGGAQEMHWLPLTLPPHVKVIVSCIDAEGRAEKALDALRTRATPEKKVEPLTDAERFEIVTQVPSLSAKTLDPVQVVSPRIIRSQPWHKDLRQVARRGIFCYQGRMNTVFARRHKDGYMQGACAWEPNNH
jgi:telomerase protein component 1